MVIWTMSNLNLPINHLEVVVLNATEYLVQAGEEHEIWLRKHYIDMASSAECTVTTSVPSPPHTIGRFKSLR